MAKVSLKSFFNHLVRNKYDRDFTNAFQDPQGAKKAGRSVGRMLSRMSQWMTESLLAQEESVVPNANFELRTRGRTALPDGWEIASGSFGSKVGQIEVAESFGSGGASLVFNLPTPVGTPLAIQTEQFIPVATDRTLAFEVFVDIPASVLVLGTTTISYGVDIYDKDKKFLSRQFIFSEDPAKYNPVFGGGDTFVAFGGASIGLPSAIRLDDIEPTGRYVKPFLSVESTATDPFRLDRFSLRYSPPLFDLSLSSAMLGIPTGGPPVNILFDFAPVPESDTVKRAQINGGYPGLFEGGYRIVYPGWWVFNLCLSVSGVAMTDVIFAQLVSVEVVDGLFSPVTYPCLQVYSGGTGIQTFNMSVGPVYFNHTATIHAEANILSPTLPTFNILGTSKFSGMRVG